MSQSDQSAPAAPTGESLDRSARDALAFGALAARRANRLMTLTLTEEADRCNAEFDAYIQGRRPAPSVRVCDVDSLSASHVSASADSRALHAHAAVRLHADDMSVCTHCDEEEENRDHLITQLYKAPLLSLMKQVSPSLAAFSVHQTALRRWGDLKNTVTRTHAGKLAVWCT